jgi:hypothetical protein
MIRSTKLLSAACLLAMAVNLAQADNFTINMRSTADPGGYWFDPLTDTVEARVSALYSSEVRSNGWFRTMCVETNEYFVSGKTYNASVTGSTAMNGGTNVTGSSSGDPISVGTAYLYKEFALGNLDNLSGINNYATLGAALQRTVWALEGEAGYSIDSTLQWLLKLHFGDADYRANYQGNEVQVMNLTKYVGTNGDTLGSSYGTKRQDQLVLWRVPDGGMTLALLGLGLTLVGLVRRKS